MKTHHRLICLTAIFLFLAACIPALAFESVSEMPSWEYPLSPEILADRRQYITLTNRSDLLDENYEPDDLVTVTARHAVSGELRKDAHTALCALFDAAEKDGYKLYVKSSYRSYKTQKTMYYNRLAKVGRDDGFVAYPGSSDHQTGLGIDVLNWEWTKKDGMNATFIQTAEAQWMAAHCHEFGFVIRYMADKQESTGIRYEPWHLRFVGLEVAAYMTEKHFSLEEFTQDWKAYLAAWENAGGDFEELLRLRALPDGIRVMDMDADGEKELCFYYTQEAQ